MPLSYPQDYFTNFAVSTIAGGNAGAGSVLAASDTTLLLAPGSGQLFPSSFPFLLVIQPGLPGAEIVKVTARSTDTLTITRSQEGTTAPASWPLATMVQHIITAANMTNIWTAIEGIINQINTGGGAGNFSSLTVTGTSSLDNGKIVTNGSGQFTLTDGLGGTITLSAANGMFMYDASGGGTLKVGNAGNGTITTGPSGSIILTPSWNLTLNSGNDVAINSTNTVHIQPTNTLYENQVPTLMSGHQESGVGGAAFSNCVASDVVGVYVNFKTHMTTAPSSITLTSTATTNVSGSASATNITKDGFFLQWAVLANGLSKWIGTYTTVGN